MKTKHSPGPWLAQKDGPEFHVCFDHGAGLCEVALVESVETEESELISIEQAGANAQLIAAAPELLSALAEILNALDDVAITSERVATAYKVASVAYEMAVKNRGAA